MINLLSTECICSIMESSHGCMARGSHGLPKELLGFTMPYISIPCTQLPLRRPYNRFSGRYHQGGQPAAVFYLLGYPTLYGSESIIFVFMFPVILISQ